MTEHDLKDKVHAYLTELVRTGNPVWFFKVGGGPYQRVGVPDYLLCVRGHFAAIELKSPAEPARPTPRQERELMAIQRAEGACLVTNSLGAVQEHVAGLLARAPGPFDARSLSVPSVSRPRG